MQNLFTAIQTLPWDTVVLLALLATAIVIIAICLGRTVNIGCGAIHIAGTQVPPVETKKDEQR
ncbi:hypothetical protein [Novipirellula rosea]|uniref:Uncharacterized protein n=1 Tax=Novipirellula rosea TaxID=1031540 RepID=A0ABP8N4I5_9BACT